MPDPRLMRAPLPETWIPLSIAAIALLAVAVSDEPLPTVATDSRAAALVHVQLATDFERDGRFDLAEREYRAALAIEPRMDAWVGVGMIALRQDRVQDAERAFVAATVLDPSSYPAWLDLGIARARLGQHQGAIEPFTRALALQPGSLDIQHNLGTTWMNLGDAARAAESLEPVVRQDPSRLGSWQQLVRVRDALGQTAGADEARAQVARLGGG